jgi:hypothetical protein
MVPALSFVAWAGLFTACRLSPHMLDPHSTPPADCPVDHYIAGVGSSDSSGEEARQRARADVARQVHAAVESNTQRISQILREQSMESQSIEFSEEIKESSRFSHSHLIKDTGPVEKHKGRYHALACLDRNEAQKALWSDASLVVSKYESAADSAARLASVSLTQFSTQYAKANLAIRELLVLFADLRALMGKTSQEELRIMAKHKGLQAQAMKLLSGIRIALHAEGVEESMSDETLSVIENALQDLGLQSYRGQGCTKEASHEIALEISPQCREVMGNHFCNPEVKLRFSSCLEESEFMIPISTKKPLSGRARQENAAIRIALDQITPDLITPRLKRGLDHSLPI